MSGIVAVDPGKDGSIALLSENWLRLRSMPLVDGEWSPKAMSLEVQYWKEIGMEKVVIEDCHAFPGISAHANAEVMRAFGMWQGAVASFFPVDAYYFVPAQTWKKAMGILVPIKKAGKKATIEEKRAAYTARKALALSTARARFPHHSFKTPRGRDLDGQAEAALLALYLQENP